MIGIYRVHNLINDKNYVGQSNNIEGRLWEHRTGAENKFRHTNKHLQNAIKRYGVENFEFLVVEECSKDMLDEREIYWISYYEAYTKGYNKTLGGQGTSGLKFTEEYRKSLSEAQKKLWSTEEHRKKMHEARLGHPCSEETRRKMSESAKVENLSKETRRKKSLAMIGNKRSAGRQISEDTRKKLREIHLGKYRSEESRKNISLSKQGENNPAFGTKTVYRIVDGLVENQRVSKSSINEFLINNSLDGWKLGRGPDNLPRKR